MIDQSTHIYMQVTFIGRENEIYMYIAYKQKSEKKRSERIKEHVVTCIDDEFYTTKEN
jgi:hypothetical protein